MEKELGIMLKSRRLELGLSCEEVSLAIGFKSYRGLKLIETGQTAILRKHIDPLSEILQISKSKLEMYIRTSECEVCGKTYDIPKRKLFNTCSNKCSRYFVRRRNQSAGLCPDCGNPMDREGFLCSNCLEKKNTRQRKEK